MPSWKICKAPDIGYSSQNKNPNGYMVNHTTTMYVPCHPYYTSRGIWVNGSPLSKYVIMVEPFGQFEIPSGAILSANIFTIDSNPVMYLRFRTIFDVSTGDCRLETMIRTGSGNDDYTIFNIQNKNCAVEVPVHQAVQDVMGVRKANRDIEAQQVAMVADIAGTVVGAKAGTLKNPVGEISNFAGRVPQQLNSIYDTVDTAVRANQVSISGGGSTGSYISFARDLMTPKVICYFNELTDEDNTEFGRPYMKYDSIIHGNFGNGFYKFSNPDFFGSRISTREIEMINSYLSGGIFYE